jgi:hypothetical protein
MITHRVIIWAAGPGEFGARIDRDILARATTRPFHDAARTGLAQPDDLLANGIASIFSRISVKRSIISFAKFGCEQTGTYAQANR